MKYAIKSRKILTPAGFFDGYLLVEDGKIKDLTKEVEAGLKVEDYRSQRIIPGIIDIHNHGALGWSMTDPCTVADVAGYAKALPSIGVTSVLPTAKEEAFAAIADYMENPELGTKIPGIHSEGPFWVRGGENSVNENYPKPDVAETKRLLDLAKGKLIYMAIAPDAPGAHEVIRFLNKNGVLVAACHTRCTAEDVFEAVRKTKIDSVTHLGNGMDGIHHRHVGSLGGFLLCDNLYYEIITDLHHICADMLKLYFRIQPYDKFMLISDSNYMSGMPSGKYSRYDRIMNMTEDGLIKDQNGRICGSGKYVLSNIKMLVEKVDVPLEKAVQMASINPARFLSIDDKTGSIERGKACDVIVIDENYDCVATYIDGQLAYDCKHPKDVINAKAMSRKLD